MLIELIGFGLGWIQLDPNGLDWSDEFDETGFNQQSNQENVNPIQPSRREADWLQPDATDSIQYSS